MSTPDPALSDKPCEICGSFACEWEGNIQLGCTDCGYEFPDPVGIRRRKELYENTPYEIRDPKHPDHHDAMSAIWDNREGK